MFTGIITHLGLVNRVIRGDKQDLILEVSLLSKDITSCHGRPITLGASICCSGICLTVTEINKQDDQLLLSFKASEETISKTTIEAWQPGHKINIEFPLRAADELGGHLVSGHVDGITTVKSIKAVKDSRKFIFQPPWQLMKFICPKGSVALEGVSLTVNEIMVDHKQKSGLFAVNIIEHTWNNTNFQYLSEGQKVNIEIDLIARYLSNLMEFRDER